MADTETTSFLSYLRSRLNERQQRIRRRIELIRLRRIRHKTTPRYTYCKNCGTRLEGMYCYRCGQYALDTEQLFGNTSANTSRTCISLTAKSG